MPRKPDQRTLEAKDKKLDPVKTLEAVINDMRDPALEQRLIEAGIKGIWNFTSIDLHLDMPEIPVENVHFSESLMVLSYKIK